ncbi:MAG: TetR family transcriptional regulator C-terminal domain-containing protein [Desulfomonile tiedjei]|nr:TetR family transcriptional regulator C-terminal domain-containing protein [Desulfomonile tiedjei]
MTRENTKDKILSHAASIIRQKGFNNTGIQEILQTAGVPKGSFYFYFKSKEDLGLALIDYYGEFFVAVSESTLRNQELPPLQRLERFFEGRRLTSEEEKSMSGCPIGNLAQEMGSLNDAFQAKLRHVFNGMQRAIRECLEQARAQGEIDAHLDPEETAHFILNSWEGALLRMKAERSTEPLVLFEKMVFGRVLKR